MGVDGEEGTRGSLSGVVRSQRLWVTCVVNGALAGAGPRFTEFVDFCLGKRSQEVKPKICHCSLEGSRRPQKAADARWKLEPVH